MAAEILREKILAKIALQLPSLIGEAIKELLEEDNLTGDELLEKVQHKPPQKKPEKEKKATTSEKRKTSGYDKLPQDETELHKWMKDLFEKRKKTKLGDEKDGDKIFNVVTQRFIKRTSCQSRKDCSLVEIEYDGKKMGFTEGGNGDKIETVPQFKSFINLFEGKRIDEGQHKLHRRSSFERRRSETIGDVAYPENDENDPGNALENLILKKLEVKSLTLAELKKQTKSDQLVEILKELTERGLIQVVGKYYQLIKADEDEPEPEADVFYKVTDEEDVE